MRSQGRGEHAMAEQRAVAAGARTGSSAGLAKSPWRDIGRRLSWSSKILRSGLHRPTSGHRRPFPHIRSAILKTSQPRIAMPTPQKSMTETTASFYFYMVSTALGVGGQVTKLFVRGERWASLPFGRAIIMRPDPASAPAFLGQSSAISRLVQRRRAPAPPHSEAGAGPHFLRSELAL
jgi:hypothetical protein